MKFSGLSINLRWGEVVPGSKPTLVLLWWWLWSQCGGVGGIPHEWDEGLRHDSHLLIWTHVPAAVGS